MTAKQIQVRKDIGAVLYRHGWLYGELPQEDNNDSVWLHEGWKLAEQADCAAFRALGKESLVNRLNHLASTDEEYGREAGMIRDILAAPDDDGDSTVDYDSNDNDGGKVVITQ